jgi:hypothetical protein
MPAGPHYCLDMELLSSQNLSPGSPLTKRLWPNYVIILFLVVWDY